MTEHVTFCRICEPTCGTVATVTDGTVSEIRPDRDHPITKGFSCPKGLEFVHIQNDADRLLHPMRRRPDGAFERVSWQTALSEIGARLRAIRAAHGGESIGWYLGNPSAFSHSHAIWSGGFIQALGSHHHYSASTQDTASRFAASALLYGNPAVVPMPDVHRTDFLLMIGANPLVSHGSVLSAGNLRPKLNDIVKRGGRVVVVDPRRTETARAYEHVAIRPDGDAWLLLAMLHVNFGENLADEAALARQAVPADELRAAAAACSPEAASQRTGLEPDVIRGLARDFAASPTAVVYGRTGTCLGRYATLVNVLIDAVNLVTGNLDSPGGAVFGRSPIDVAKLASLIGLATYDTYRSRVGNLPEVLGELPAALMAAEIETPGPGQLRALIVSAGNPVLSTPNGERLSRAMDQLDLQVGIDMYVNETHRNADYVLPAATFLERDDLVVPLLDFQLTPFVQWTEAVVPPRGEAREDWRIVTDLARELGFAPVAGPATRFIGSGRIARSLHRVSGPLARRITPALLIDTLLRAGRDGDRFGLRRGGLNLKKLRAMPHGKVLAEHVETGILGKRVVHKDRRVHLDADVIVAELRRMAAEPAEDPAYPLRMIGRRELRSHNSWTHNLPKFRDSERGQRAIVHPKDAAEVGVADGDQVRVHSATGVIEVPVELSEDIAQGTISVPHGWGHRGGGWQTANALGGANVNELASDRPEDLEQVSGMSHLNAIAVRLEPVRVEAPV